LGVEPKELTFLQVSLRGVIVFIVTLVMVRLSSKRSLAEKTAFDAALIVIIASVLARAINGSAPFFPTLGIGFILVFIHRLLGVEPKELTFLQVSLRGVIVFIVTLVMVRLSSKRSLAEKTAFDAALIVIIASVLARAINGSAPFFPTLGIGFILVLLHRLLGL